MDGYRMEDRIRDLIEKLYDCVFTGRIEFKHIDDVYIAEIYIQNQTFGPLQIVAECSSDEEFLQILCRELKKMNLTSTKYIKINLYEPNKV